MGARRRARRIAARTAIRDRMGAMPPFFVEKDIGIHEFKDDPSLGYYASDNLMGAVLGDDQLADFVFGRLSSRSTAETNVMVDKILTYGQNPPLGNWRRHGLFVSDRGKNFNTQWAFVCH